MKSWAPTAVAAARISSLRGVRAAERDVVAHRAGEEEALLRNDPELAAERLLRHVAQVGPVDRDPSLARVVEASEELGDRRLARPRVPDERDGRPGGDVEIEAVQDLRPVAVAEVEALERDVAFDPAELAGTGAVPHLRLLIHHVHDLVESGDGGEERVVELRQLLDGVEEVRDVEDEREERPHRDLSAGGEVAAVAQHDGGRDGRQEVDEREVEPVREDGLLVRLAVVRIDLLEVAPAARLARERLDDAHAGDVLGERGRDEAEALAHGAVGAGAAHPKDRGRHGHRRDDGQRREREPPVEQEEDDRRADEQERVLDERRDAVRDQLVERVDVVRQPADDHACPVALEVAERQALEMAEEPVAKVGEDPLTGPAGEVRLRRGSDKVRDPRGDEEDDDRRQRLEVPLADPVVDCELGEVGRDERRQRRREQREDGEGRPELVRGGQARQGRHAPGGSPPRPVFHLDITRPGQMRTGLPDPHAVASAASARSSTRSANSRSSKPCS